MSLKIINKGYKANIAIDMVKACLLHYAKWERPIEAIILSPKMWDEFTKGLCQLEPEKEDDIKFAGEVEFKNCNVKKGSEFMIKSLTVTLKQRILE